MSRIRSTHPGIWTDERFVGVSAFARLLFMGIWNECDDYGSFEWSPLKLKMRLLPADPVDAAELLAELEAAGSVKRYEIDGKAYGAVRNFCQYQRPKKPTSIHPQTPDISAFVNTEARSTRDGSEGVGNQLPTSGEKSRQMKEEGGRRVVPLSNDNGAEPDSDKQFWDGAKAYLGKGKASLIGKWVSDHGKEATASAITAAQLERAINPVEFIQGRFRKVREPPAAIPI